MIVASFRFLCIKILENKLNNNYNMSQRNSWNKKPEERHDSGRYKSACSCITHAKWSYEGIWKTVNMKKSTLFGANIIKEMGRHGFISSKSNVLCTECYRKYKERYLI